MFKSTQNKKYEIELFHQQTDEYNTFGAEFYNFFCSTITHHIGWIKDEEASILEVGCGTGIFGKQLQLINPKLKIIGIDLVPAMVEIARKGNYNAIVGDVEDKTLFNENAFDLIICPFILHHFPTTDIIFDNFKLWLKADGSIVIVEPNGSNPIYKISRLLRYFTEIIFGKNFILRHNLASPNEIDHSIQYYLEKMKKINIKPLFITTCYPKRIKSKGISNIFAILVFFKGTLIKLSHFFPKYYKGDIILIIGKMVSL